MSRFKKVAGLKEGLATFKNKFRGQKNPDQQLKEDADKLRELKLELKSDYGLSDRELDGKSLDQLHQELLRMKERRKNALEFLKTKTQLSV